MPYELKEKEKQCIAQNVEEWRSLAAFSDLRTPTLTDSPMENKQFSFKTTKVRQY